MMAYDNLQRYKCDQCGGYVWECNEKIARQFLTHDVKVAICSKTIARESARGQVVHTHQNKGAGSKGKKPYSQDPTTGRKWYTKSRPKQEGMRMPSYADWVLYNIYEDV